MDDVSSEDLLDMLGQQPAKSEIDGMRKTSGTPATPAVGKVETLEATESIPQDTAELVAVETKEVQNELGKLIFMDDMRKALAIGVVAEKNIISFGWGGHAKSELLIEVQRAWDGQGDVWIQSLNANSNVPDLLGGYSPEHIKEFRFDRPLVEESAFGRAKVIVFEEAFDAPPRVITAMKDILTAKGWRHGPEFVPMVARSVILVSNHDPDDVRKINPSVDALIQRFPLVVRVEWAKYTEDDFKLMLDVLGGRAENPDQFALPHYDELVKIVPVPFSDDDAEFLSHFLAAAVSERAKISPRTGVYCMEILTAWAAICGDSSVKEEHYEILRLVGDVRDHYDKAWERCKYYMKTSEDRNFMRNIKGQFTRLKKKAEPILDALDKSSVSSDQMGEALEMAKKVASIKADINTRAWQDSTYDGYQEVDSELDEVGSKLLQAAGIST